MSLCVQAYWFQNHLEEISALRNQQVRCTRPQSIEANSVQMLSWRFWLKIGSRKESIGWGYTEVIYPHSRLINGRTTARSVGVTLLSNGNSLEICSIDAIKLDISPGELLVIINFFTGWVNRACILFCLPQYNSRTSCLVRILDENWIANCFLLAERFKN